MYKSIKVSEFLHRIKEPVELDPDQEYSLVTIRVNHKGVVLRNKTKGSLIGSKMYRISKGQFILSGIDARRGAFGIVPDELDGAIITNDFWCFNIDETKVKRDFFYWLTTTPIFLNACIKSSQGVTQRIRLQQRLFFDFEFRFPPLEEQENFIKKIYHVDYDLNLLRIELNNQANIITQLKQSILQEAISGQLTAEWRSHHPIKKGDPNFDAKALLAKIKAEKEVLMAEGKLKKEKPLPEILPDDIPFDLPKSWVWCRLGDVCTKITDGFHHTPKKQLKGKIYISATHIRETGINWKECLYINEEEHNSLFKKAYPQKGEILITNRGAGCGTPAIIDIDQEFSFQNTALIGFNQSLVSSKYMFSFILKMRSEIMDNFVNGGLQPMLSNVTLGKIPFPLPPLAEQKIIVEKVDHIMKIIDQLEEQIKHRQKLAEDLMQTVLQEAFE